ncbi:hypothetical protein Pst134EB_026133 [Puccinia striiformis f. sp. tritici]|nr:hypothetical protein Pst134EB_026133 [Puccinia striiformis f. sp. tritici]
MFLQTSALVVYGALLALVTTTKASQPKGRLTKRFFSAAKDAGGARSVEKGIFTTSYMNQFTPLPGESGLSLMEFHASHRVLGVDSKDMDRFVNAVASDNMEEATTTKRFKIEDLYEKHLYYLEHHRNQFPFLSSMEFDQVSKQLRDLVLDHPTGEDKLISLEDYFSLINTYKPGINEEATRFISWKLGKEWRNKYKDTVKIRIADLLDSYMEWAWKDSKLKENLWVRSWIEGNEEFVLDALGERLMKLKSLPWWHWRKIVGGISGLWKKMIKAFRKKTT